jgi:hypothetical protein
MKSTFSSFGKWPFWEAASKCWPLPVSYDMVVAQLERHGLVDIRVVIQRPGDNLNVERGKEQALTQ